MDPKHTTPRDQYEWSEEQTKQAVELFRGGETANEIAVKLGCTRNAVIGKMGRLGEKSPNTHYLPRVHGERKAVPAPKPKARPNMQTINARASRRNPIQPHVPMIPVRFYAKDHVAPKATRKTFLGLSGSDCRFPCDTSPEGDLWFCGARQAEGMPYCASHCRIAYQAPVRRHA